MLICKSTTVSYTAEFLIGCRVRNRHYFAYKSRWQQYYRKGLNWRRSERLHNVDCTVLLIMFQLLPWGCLMLSTLF